MIMGFLEMWSILAVLIGKVAFKLSAVDKLRSTLITNVPVCVLLENVGSQHVFTLG